ncbi:MAG: methyl-accepting chemotaxis protein [Burkholderiales bacterium]|nr:methyl-accepting chemotaxis protein [Burkholderiales bacterium]
MTLRSAPQASNAPAHPHPSGGFFAVRGPWALGVRLFRQIGFATKSVMITAAFAIPLAVLSWGFFTNNAKSIAFSAAEREGVTYLRALLPELEAAQAARAAAMRGERPPAPSGTRLADVQKSLGEALGTAAQWKAVQDARAAIAGLATDAPSERQYVVHGAHVAALSDLMSQAADGSNLTLDPDVDTYYLMDAVTTKVPALAESLSQLAATAHAATVAGKATDAQRRRADRVATVGESGLAALESAIGKVLAQRKDLVQTLRLDTAATKARAALEAGSQAVDADALPRDGARIAGLAQAALEQLRTAQVAQLEALDAAIAVRIGGLASERNATAVLVAVTLLLAGYLFRTFYLVTRGGLQEVGWHIDAMARGDLTRAPQPWGRDEAAMLMTSLATTQASLCAIVSQVRTGADSIVGASAEISAGSLELSSRTEQTAASLEESAASMEEISTTVRGTSDNARKGSEIAAGNAEVARRGGQVIDNVVQTMQEIQKASAQIASIISVIDGIAFQTNILALNAAVEAARAGEQGRGFAVVAGEVRALSQRSAEAARDIKRLIDTTVKKVADGATVVRSAGETMKQIVIGAEELEALSTAIADAANQQDAGVSQIGSAIQELDRGAQQNAALVEQTAAAAGQLKDQASALAETVAVFKLPAAVSGG